MRRGGARGDRRACSDDGGGSTAASTTAVTSATSTTVKGAAAEYAAHPDDWVLPGHDYDNSRAATGSGIDASNVDTLKKAWSATMQGPLSTAPLVVGDTVYLQDGSGRITALDRDEGDDALADRRLRVQHRSVRRRGRRRPGVRHARLEGRGRRRRGDRPRAVDQRHRRRTRPPASTSSPRCSTAWCSPARSR